MTFTDTKCIGILKMKLIIIVMIKTSGIFKNMIVTSSTRTPSFCSDKNLSLVFSSPSSSDRLSTKNTYLQTSHELETWHVLRT